MSEVRRIRDVWASQWAAALDVWSRFTRLPDPTWCLNKQQRLAAQMHDGFAMIKLQDHEVVIGIDEVARLGLGRFGLEVLAHEIGHHVYAPADLVDNARLLARMRYGLPGQERKAPMVSNLYTDLLINDRLQRSAELDMAGVYKALRHDAGESTTPLWALYMRSYERLWSLPSGTLVDPAAVAPETAADAALVARLIRVFARNWMDGARRFAVILLPYLQGETDDGESMIVPWMDALAPGAGDEVPDGLASIDAGEGEAIVHPSDDPRLNGLGRALDPNYEATGRETVGGRKNAYREPSEYIELMESLGVKVDAQDLVIRYYRERAVRHIVPFPSKISREASDPLPEGLEVWDLGSSLSQIDWTATVVRSPLIIPGLTTVERVYGSTQGTLPQKTPVDLYLGVDCSGSMGNPAHRMSFPVVAGAVITLSALRAGARVMVELSGSPGEYSVTDGFVRNERDAMSILTGYLGTGYAYGIERLEASIVQAPQPFPRPVHLLIVTDSDIFRMIADNKRGWHIVAEAARLAGGGATFVLDIHSQETYGEPIARMRACGWDVYNVGEQSELVAFARAFARRHYLEEMP